MTDIIRPFPAESAPLTQFIGVKELSQKLGICIMTVRRWEKNGNLPPSFRMSKFQHRRWNLEEVRAHLAAKAAK